MEIELYPAVSLLSETNSRLDLHRHKILFICGNHFRILSRLDRNVTDLADRVFCIFSQPAKVRVKPEARMPEAKSTLEARS